ncbi:hypothetical protein [Uliginosibacterium gangwonense]|uniref:hypothetical protein n=1 Tax=Uliginosibacterium gangwonense TaxID=392736 RepID=UPI000380D5FD|nr:hypothetical protein [Uliginosibacterium gangwonense]
MSINLDLTTLIMALPEQAQRTVLYGLVGSLNARVIGSCARIVQYVEREGSDVSTEIVNGFAKTAEDARLRADLGTGHDTWLELLDTVALRDNLHALLASVVNDDEVLPYSGTLAFMTSGEARVPNKEQLDALVAALATPGLTAEVVTTVYKAEVARQRAEMAAKSHSIMDVLTALPYPEDYDEETDYFCRLPHLTQLAITNKALDALNKARNNVVVGMLQRRSSANIGDIPLINAAMGEVDVALRNADSGLDNTTAQQIAEQQVAEHKKAVRRSAAAKKAAATRKLTRCKTGETATVPA